MFIYIHGLEMRDTSINSIIKVHYIWFYNVYILCILIVKSFIHTKTQVEHHFKKVSLLTVQNSYKIVTQCNIFKHEVSNNTF